MAKGRVDTNDLLLWMGVLRPLAVSVSNVFRQ